MIIKASSRLGEVKQYYFATKLAEIAKMNANGDDVLNLGIGSPDLAPPAEVIDALTRSAHHPAANKYQSYRGLLELRQAFAAFYKRHFDVNLNANSEILPLIGSKEGIMHIAMSFLNPGDEVLVPNPGYPSYRMTTELAGGTSMSYELSESSGWLPDLTSLEKKDLSRVKLMWINYPHMPTGGKADIHFYKKLVAFAKRNKILICHDNPYNFILNDTPVSIFQIEGAKECCLELTSLSKAHNMAGWRVGALAGREDYVNLVMRFKSNMDSGMYAAVQKAAVTALNQGPAWFSSLNEIYTKRRAVVRQLFDQLDCSYQTDAAGLFVWAKAPEYVADVQEWADEILRKSKVFITPGIIFGSQGERYLRIALCSDIPTFHQAMTRIEQHITQPITQMS